jgi:hypothetical protein
MFEVRRLRTYYAEPASAEIRDIWNDHQRIAGSIPSHVLALLRERDMPGLQGNRQSGMTVLF